MLELKTEEFGDTFTDTAAGASEEFISDCVVESDLELRLPPSYVPQESERIALYQRLDNMTSPDQTEIYSENLRDRFGPIPQVTEELIKVVPLRFAARRLGIERLNLKGGRMYLYLVGDDNKAYYMSSAFGKVLGFMQTCPRRCFLRDREGKRSVVIENVPSVSEALYILISLLAAHAL